MHLKNWEILLFSKADSLTSILGTSMSFFLFHGNLVICLVSFVGLIQQRYCCLLTRCQSTKAFRVTGCSIVSWRNMWRKTCLTKFLFVWDLFPLWKQKNTHIYDVFDFGKGYCGNCNYVLVSLLLNYVHNDER